MKKILLVLAIALAAMSMSSCIVLRDVQDTNYTYSEPAKKKPNRPSNPNSGSTKKPSRPGSTTSKPKNSKPNRP